MGTVLTILGGIGVLAGVLVWTAKWAFKKYVLPAIKTREQKDLAENIAQVADDVTDNLKEMFPDAKWDDILDKAVDEIKQVIHDKEVPERTVKTSVLKRAAVAAIARKKARDANFAIDGPGLNKAVDRAKKEVMKDIATGSGAQIDPTKVLNKQ
jgi:hypothetical protein